MSTIQPSELKAAIDKILDEYIDGMDDIVIEQTDKLIAQAKAEVKTLSPKDTGVYAKSWGIKTIKGSRYYCKKIYNKEKGPLAHLLEWGHATKNGGHTKAQPHVTTVELKYKEQFLENLEKEIKQ